MLQCIYSDSRGGRKSSINKIHINSIFERGGAKDNKYMKLIYWTLELNNKHSIGKGTGKLIELNNNNSSE